MQGDRVEYVHDRYRRLADLVEGRGFQVAARDHLSEWDEGRRKDPIAGVVRVRGERQVGETRVSFTVKEWWGLQPADGVLEEADAVLVGYHYTAQSVTRQVRHCYDPIRHPEAPCHRHIDDGAGITPENSTTVEAALQEFEEQLVTEALDEAGPTARFDDDPDEVDAIFGEED